MNTRGKLKIFFGYSAGVGKTYAMLTEGWRLKRQGVDVVIGYFEPHARPETMKLAEGFETIPLKEIDYKGILLKEFDVDQAILRKPQYILVDELAHTNAYGSKNRKRYLDVLELLNNGINVYTTVNVQHLESLNDIVDSKTQVDVSERIPDDIFDLAEEISIIDIEPVDLIERMKAGKIYKSGRINVALENFFKYDNLSSLRELTMRKMADRIEKQKNNGMRPSKFLVLISPSPSSAKNIRVAARMALAYHAKFSALYVETNSSLSDESAEQLKKHMALVKDLSGDIIVKYSDDVVETIADYVKIAGVTNLIIGKTWQSIGKKVSFESKIISRLPNIEVLIVPDRQSVNSPRKTLRDYLLAFSRRKYIEKFRMANKTLDIIKILSQEIDINKPTESLKKIVLTLSRAFARGVMLKIGEDTFLSPYANIDINFFDEEVEITAANWCLVNKNAAGRGTNTLRNAKAIYFPIVMHNYCIGVVGFSCIYRKFTITERLLFQQICSTLALDIRMLINKDLR